MHGTNLPRRPHPVLVVSALLLVAASLSAPAAARAGAAGPGPEPDRPPHYELLPPLPPWHGASEEIPVSPDHEWATPFERSGLADSPSYDDTVAWVERLVAAAPELEMVSLGKSPEGRDLWMVIASTEGARTPEALRATGKPTVLAQAGIHSGEIDGKDAGMMLLRDLTVRRGETGKGNLLERANLLWVPIFSVDAHERRSLYGRINQRGPLHTGWRTTSRNLNLNRDYTKLDTLEMRHMVRALDAWAPDLYLDLHVTDGADYQYDVTFGFNGPHGWSPRIGSWLQEVFRPAVAGALESMGHVPGPLVFLLDRTDPRGGIPEWTAGPRYSNGYGDARHLPTVLVENHSLKPYDRRVLGTYVLLEETLRLMGERGHELRRAAEADRSRHPETVPLAFRPGDGPPAKVEFRGIELRLEPSAISGGLRPVWTGEPFTAEVPQVVTDVPAATAERPAAYWIPPAWRDVIERLEVHGIRTERIEEPRELEVEMLRLTGPEYAEGPFEGRFRVTATPVAERRTERFPPGSVRVPTDQPLGDLAVLLLEPAAPDSFFQWGFFHEVLERTEYVESYVMEPYAARMLEEDPELRRELVEALAEDEELRGDPRARLRWFYEKTPYWDERWLLYPVARELSAGDATVE
ncbi:MAG: M14 family metallopeptidase [Acidobacteriota bacterium]|jgi:murein tripeptide amidase MpaA